MVELICPTCNRTASVPDDLADAGEQCYRCRVPLRIADPAVAEQRAADGSARQTAALVGAAAGAVVVPVAVGFGGPAGASVVAGVFGMLAGVAVALLEYAVFGIGFVEFLLVRQYSFDRSSARACERAVVWVALVGGGVFGLVRGVAHVPPITPAVVAAATGAGFLVGGAIGYALVATRSGRGE